MNWQLNLNSQGNKSIGAGRSGLDTIDIRQWMVGLNKNVTIRWEFRESRCDDPRGGGASHCPRIDRPWHHPRWPSEENYEQRHSSSCSNVRHLARFPRLVFLFATKKKKKKYAERNKKHLARQMTFCTKKKSTHFYKIYKERSMLD